ncbi:GrpB family protein [Pedobacter sp. MC2016-15]|uniref:GrpB family protein n=1 Tax=Pedobacter sp. MC2016-15 TaxID=2994473 RepID=UPI002247F100|nr:GrpB family protein [Pedobacter sp. MC2016-15]MCX2478189.1 GrpB family protein [Pedobacter sp. MC2016-15]
MKTLSDLTAEEIGQLFPIEISPYDPNWPKLYEEERQLIEKNIPPSLFFRIEHFGSTSVPGLSSKNTIDILMAVEFESTTEHEIIEPMKKIGYDFNWQNEGANTHMVFIKGYDPNNPKQQTYHIHAAPESHSLWNRIHFRDYLIKHPETAKDYEDLKKTLADKHKHERVAYRIAKTEFVKEITDKCLLDLKL